MASDEGTGVFFLRDVLHHLRIRPDKQLMWSAGALLRQWWLDRTGTLPPKKLAPKTDGSGGTHCHAYYPMWAWDAAVRIVTSLRGRPDPQRCFDFY
jgi:hypothetical protein